VAKGSRMLKPDAIKPRFVSGKSVVKLDKLLIVFAGAYAAHVQFSSLNKLNITVVRQALDFQSKLWKTANLCLKPV
jgi:hypothetical protein